MAEYLFVMICVVFFFGELVIIDITCLEPCIRISGCKEWRQGWNQTIEGKSNNILIDARA